MLKKLVPETCTYTSFLSYVTLIRTAHTSYLTARTRSQNRNVLLIASNNSFQLLRERVARIESFY